MSDTTRHTDEPFEVWSTQFGHVQKLRQLATKETASSFMFGRRRRAKDCDFQQLRRTEAECEAIAKAYREKEAAKQAMYILERAAPELLAALEEMVQRTYLPDAEHTKRAKAAIAKARGES